MVTVKNWFNDLLLVDHWRKVHGITKTVGISKGLVGHILHEILDMRKRTSATLRPFQRSVLRCLSASTKQGDTRDQETVQTVDFIGQKYSKDDKDRKGFAGIHIHYLEKDRTVTNPYYTELYDRFDTELQKKWPHLSKKRWQRTGANPRLHHEQISQIRLRTAAAPKYLAPFNTLLFPSSKSHSPDKNFSLMRSLVVTATKAYFADLQRTYWVYNFASAFSW